MKYIHGPETNYFTTKKLKFSEDFSLLMVAVHFPSKLRQNEQTQNFEAAEFKREIEAAEEELGSMNTFVVGDFNMNPFEPGMVGASAFHSISSEAIAKTESRIIKGRKHRFYYNPMWNLTGDFDDNPGTYFHRSSEQAVYFWNILDQVILRPKISSLLKKESLKVLNSIHGVPLVSESGRPQLSDHLPIYFELDLSEKLNYEKSMA